MITRWAPTATLRPPHITDSLGETDAARAAATTARVNVEINLGGIKDEAARAELLSVLGEVDGIVAEAVTAAAREEIAK